MMNASPSPCTASIAQPSIVTILVEYVFDERALFPHRPVETILVQRADELSSIVHADTRLEPLAFGLTLLEGVSTNLCNPGVGEHLLAHVSHLHVALELALAGMMMTWGSCAGSARSMRSVSRGCAGWAGARGVAILVSFASEAAA